MATYPIRTRRLTRKEYEHLVELGVQTLNPEATVSPLALPDAAIAVADLLP
jgi:hypothetical protein